MLRVGKTLLIISLGISLIGCPSLEIKPHKNIAYSWSHRFKQCIEYSFVISKGLVGREGDSRVVDDGECDNITGFKNSGEESGWPTLKTWLEVEVFENVEDQGLSKKKDRPSIIFNW